MDLGFLTLEDVERAIRKEIKKSEISNVTDININSSIHKFLESESYDAKKEFADVVKDCIKYIALSMA